MEETDEDEFVSEHEHDTSYVMGSEDEEEENDECAAVIKTPDFDMMFVSWEQIKPLFSHCIRCGSPANISKLYSIGATVFVTTECTAGHKNVWNSLEHNAKEYNGHVDLSASILLSGSTYQPFREAMDIAKVGYKICFYLPP